MKTYEEMTMFGDEDYETAWLLHNGIIDQVDSIYEEDARGLGSCLDLIGSLIDSGEIELDKIRYRLWASPGGGAGAALAAHDYLRSFAKKYDLPIQVEVYGFAASAASMILLQAGDTRLASPSSTFLLHEVRQFGGWDTERTSDVADKKTGMDMITKVVYDIIANRCGHTYDEVYEYIDRREAWMDWDEALEWGLIDGPV
jgi:ATP-dependent protease ClpP protease subunit